MKSTATVQRHVSGSKEIYTLTDREDEYIVDNHDKVIIITHDGGFEFIPLDRIENIHVDVIK